jgi:hypothetical protein
MAVNAMAARAEAVSRRNLWDALFVGLAAVHGVVVATAASMVVIAVGLWWNANTIAHNFIHRPFFRSRWANRLFSVYLSAVLGIPQTFWRDRHLRHHAGRAGRVNVGSAIVIETLVIVGLWAALIAGAPRWFASVYAPGYAIGLALCWLQGHYEHARGTTSHYGLLYNALFFNDGYHVEHHRRPGAHWTELPGDTRLTDRGSRWPAVLRWLDGITEVVLENLEKIVLRSPALQRFVVDRHERAFRPLLSQLPHVRRVTIVGGGLFPRTALVLAKLLPQAAISIVDVNAANLDLARARLPKPVELIHAAYDPGVASGAADLVVIPLAFLGDRRRIYRHPPAPAVIVHDWIWKRWPSGRPVSWMLLKRLNLVRP